MTTPILSPDKNPMLPPAANRLWVSDNWNNALGRAPSFAYKLQNVVAGEQHEAVGKEGDEGFVPAYTEPDVVIDLKYENVSMTDAQWQKWSTDLDDETYILACLAENLGLQPA